ncbi:MAG: hypothetical protein Q9220_006024 [cf. Caloplaca sp. 1 TL-2023]
MDPSPSVNIEASTDEWDEHRDYHQSMLSPEGQTGDLSKEESITTPVFSVDFARELAAKSTKRPFPQYGLFARAEMVIDPEITVDSNVHWGSESVKEPADDRMFLNMNAPFSAFVCGVQGSGKSHTLSCILEMALIESKLGKLPRPLTGIVFHYDKHIGYSTNQLCEAAYLCSSGIPVTVLVSPSNYEPMKKAYENLPGLSPDQPKPMVRQLFLSQRDLNAKRMLKLMAVEDGNDSLYIQMIRKILRSVAKQSNETPDRVYTLFRQELALHIFDATQKRLLDMRLELLESFMEEQEKKWVGRPPKIRKSQSDLWSSRPGSLTIVDLSDPYIDEGEACSLFDMCLSLFLENKPEGGTILALDEAHKFMSDTQVSIGLTDSLVAVIRLQRHLGARVVIATQEPTIAPSLLDFCSMTIVHRFTSPSWLQALKDHLAGASNPSEEGQRNLKEIFKTIVNLEAGQGLLFSPSAMLVSANLSPDSGSVSKVQKLGLRYVKMRVRKRLTTDGGRSVLAA